MVFNSSENSTVFSFSSDKEYALAGNGVIDTVYPLKRDGRCYKLFMPAHSLRIVLESPFTASEKEFASARELGVSIIDGFTPVAVEGNKVTFKHVRLPGELTMAADKIILAVGQHARLDAFAELEPQRNTIKTQNYQTRDPQVFAAGDIVEGDKTVVYAVKTGKEAAEAIHHYLEGACSC